MNQGTCIHYAGFLTEGCCNAGVNYRDAFGGEAGIVLRMPCHQFRILPAHGRGTYIKAGEPTIRKEIDRRGQAMIPCKLLRLPTDDEVEQDRKETDAMFERVMAGMKVAAEWRVKPKPDQDRHGVLECPVCKGRLHVSQSAYNGHVHGKCETEDCVSWME